jgi:hypothetical protein
VNLKQIPVAGYSVQAIHVLGDKREAIAPAGFELYQSVMAGVGVNRFHLGPALVIEPPDQLRVAGKPLRTGHILNAITFPQAIGGAKGRHPTFGRHAGSGEHTHTFRLT